ncbi:hypothetical protein MKK70_13425 [Methylobacterium sp. E-041]|uniref:hypothetical protein n=1 Tax=Methylobacterium sp. E-041 TaxID=2836573 RepID=UPI001FB8AAA9|nr:hypothetical protein [Methylobacterium sp. E-041]MCJ2106365.1 hypothetical protein [Methylobacterium sp. E-041]
MNTIILENNRKMSPNRTKPNKSNREAISNLSKKNVLIAEMIGIRAIVEAEQEIIRPIGLDTVDCKGFIFTPLCIKLLHGTHGIKFTHNDTKATMSSVCKHAHHLSCMIDPASTLPRNHFAENLLEKGGVEKDTYFDHKSSNLYGDAIVVSDVRRHWCIRPYYAPNTDLTDLIDDLTTPRRLRCYSNEKIHSILFEEEPNSDDLLLLAMKFL